MLHLQPANGRKTGERDRLYLSLNQTMCCLGVERGKDEVKGDLLIESVVHPQQICMPSLQTEAKTAELNELSFSAGLVDATHIQ